ncbi:hypothetical protein ACFU93_12760 [Streptomyces sp. NPDC057611]|uniref:hypothetical protein n=1 Tax=Streptomyces sp. NPDC057611 TaxID=3346182 RepID=UPI00367672D4
MTSQSDLSPLVPSQAAPPALHSGDIHVRWVVPEIFHDLPVRETDDEKAVELLEGLVEKCLPGVGEDGKTQFGVMCALCVDALLAVGAEYAAICVSAVDDMPCTATVYAALVDSPDAGNVRGVVKAFMSALRRTGMDEVSEIELPCGVAVSCIGTREEDIPGDLMESGESLTYPTSCIRVYVPFPNGTTLVMEMATPTMVGWDIFSTIFGNIVSSIRLFRADGSPLITSEVEA